MSGAVVDSRDWKEYLGQPCFLGGAFENASLWKLEGADMVFANLLLKDRLVDEQGVGFLSACGVRDYDSLLGLIDAFPNLTQEYLDVTSLSALALRHVSQGVARAYHGGGGRPPIARAHGARDPSAGGPQQVPRPSRGSSGNGRGGGPRGPKIDLSRLPAIDNRGVCGTWPIKDQGERGTCVAFAVVASLEHHHGPHGGPTDLAEQYLYWASKQSPRDPQPKLDGAKSIGQGNRLRKLSAGER